MLDALCMWRRFAGLPELMVQLSRVEIAGEVRAAHGPVNPFSEAKHTNFLCMSYGILFGFICAPCTNMCKELGGMCHQM